MDLIVPPGPGIPRGLVIPNDALLERFSRSSGPGGQGVNTADSRVELELSLATTPGLTDSQRRRVIAALGERIVVTASEHRQQRRNRVAARERLADLLPTSPSAPGHSPHAGLPGASPRRQAPAFLGQVEPGPPRRHP